jgi:hypothetical protein
MTSPKYKPAMRRLLILALLFTVTLQAETPADVYSDRRKDLQGQFARAQKAIYQDPTKATEADNAEMRKVNAAINVLKADFLSFEQARYFNWNNRSYWYRGKSNYWDSGPGARRILDNLAIQLAKIQAIKAKESGPIGRPDLNESQKLLDAVREALSLDAELEQIVKNYLRR